MKWELRQVPIKFQISDKTLFAPRVQLQVREVGLEEGVVPIAEPILPNDPLQAGSQGFLIRSLPICDTQAVFNQNHRYIRYIPSQYHRYYIDLSSSFSEYTQKFSAKTRSTIQRKIKKYREHCGGMLNWKVYTTPEDMTDFHRLARSVSCKTYQEHLLDAGLPNTEEFCKSMDALARKDQVRAFILFDDNYPVSYLYCPIHNGILVYQYLGYDPEYMKLSVGTILQWLALEHIFEERRFRLFDFTEGQSDHKRLFATHSLQCANVFFLENNLSNFLLIQSHMRMESIIAWVGKASERLGLKTTIKKLIRFGK